MTATAQDIAELAGVLAQLAPRIEVGTQGTRGRLWACLGGSGPDGGFTDDEASLLHSVGLVCSDGRCLVPPARVATATARLLRVLAGRPPSPLVWQLMVTDNYAINKTPAMLAWFDGQVALRVGDGDPVLWDRWENPEQLDRYLRSTREYEVVTSPYDHNHEATG